MKLEVGMYVRFKNGSISRITKIDDKILFQNVFPRIFVENEEEPYIHNDFVKASYEIIDLIEVGDVISFKEDIDNYKKTYAIGIPDIMILDEVKDKILNDNIRLIGILTHEQMEVMQYVIK